MERRKELFYRYSIEIWNGTVFITNRHFNFTYHQIPTPGNGYGYYGGLQCDYEDNTEDYKWLRNELEMIAEKALKIRSQKKTIIDEIERVKGEWTKEYQNFNDGPNDELAACEVIGKVKGLEFVLELLNNTQNLI